MSTQIAKPEPHAVAHAVTPMMLIQQASAQGASIEQMAQLFELKLRVEADEARKAFNEAMARFKSNPPRITKNVQKQAGQMALNYASLDHVCDALIPALAQHGLRHAWAMKQDGSMMTVTCTLTHELGHSEGTSMTAGYDQSGGKNGIQAIASAQTYLQRYTLLAATGQAAGGMDDDGVGSGTSQPKTGLSEGELIDRIEAIRAASTQEELKDVWAKANVAARKANDVAAQQQFAKEGERRRAQL